MKMKKILPDKNEAKTCKVVVTGDSGTGKIELIKYFTKNEFKGNITTIGSPLFCRTMTFDEFGGESIKFKIWDTSGQERFQSLSRSYFRNVDAVILVYDITNRESFENIISWYRYIKEEASEDISKKNIYYYFPFLFF